MQCYKTLDFTLAGSGLVRGHVIGIIVIIVIVYLYLWTGGAALYDGHTKEHCHCHHAVPLLTGTMCNGVPHPDTVLGTSPAYG